MSVFTEETRARAREIIARYPADRSRSALLPLLHLVQSEEGYVSPAGVEFCAEVLGLNKAQVGAVATFYTMYKRKPTGDYLVSVCTNTMCNVLGGQEVYDTLAEHLGVGHDETTGDGKITLEHAECLAACDYGPVMTVNYDFFDNVDAQTAVGVVDELRAGGRPMPTRGARLCTLKEMAIQLAGFADEREGAVADGGPGEPSLRGLRLAEQHGISVPGYDPNTPIRSKAEADKAAAEAKAKAEAAKPAPAPEPAKAASGSTAPDVKAPDAKSPQVRTAETRQPDAGTAVPDAPGTKVPTDGAPPAPRDAQAAEAAGAAANPPAGDAKPAGDDAGAQQRNLKEAEAGAGANGAGPAVASETGGQK
ncbi:MULTISPECIES: NADH-quinone oxidoreductase subunit NuoE [Micromonospora]|uniref:NADH-quinone oxidoreductase subunit NuoE n=1 Tax=Micromonospora solifontis TaxID=2487138 RepID=A0ABX9WMN3_9ACTN|nr:MULTISPECIES: NADH-quinone oxidoreductase subunit NuoE [Micromonospora]NES13312.1 NADH-quinone oxidoreductase subunit NuoE [Micromonospora sp. PPF5-17B]NES34681.1 NADH-quinone oxidoreductase subunit NuoE [Micromonospora solifontis]NES57197.1 NADH-quinone oxidoreductase subunit NuoE [Micromonospora sp. PPF5-6]RNM01921.1 NADH-quinone oxidoreductase subunit NuoE [Micromonospora solifontis]